MSFGGGSGFLKRTRPCAFYKANRHMVWTNPGRRWVPLKVTLGAITLFFGSLPFSYLWSTRLVGEDEDARLASNEIVSIMELLPLNIMSRYIGYSAQLTSIPTAWHQKLIETMIWWFNAPDLTPEDAQNYNTVHQFFMRPRHVAPSIDPKAPLVAPCDATIVQCGELMSGSRNKSTVPASLDENVKDNLAQLEASHGRLLQAKGVKYSIGTLLRTSTLPVVPEGYRRWFWTFYIPPGRYHHFHSPGASVKVDSGNYVPGMLLPLSPLVSRWLPNLYTNNERVNLLCSYNGGNTELFVKGGKKQIAEKGDSSSSSSSFLAMTLIGATARGGICLPFDQRIETNPLIPFGQFSLRLDYASHIAPRFTKGQEMGYFKLGSSVILIADIPDTVTPLGKPGDMVEVGQALVNGNVLQGASC